ncbi:nucleolar protein 12-domain-containing protein [Ampelomyces quisqualis]|uniref:Nucleolar protein 12-domain-containing protein n=1 Tax=Ampelomyces quisqualis TaxID=50730 RepID=A0A6A5QJH8_AMPQU|nr:nucleolar protein 12-domain-containing protein [Ampelomyces quisqualis]
MPPPSKKRKITVTAPEKIEFNPSAREEYLTGFHKRKVARQKFAQEEIAKKEKEEKLRFRRELRQQRKVDLEKHVEEVNRLVKQANGDITELHGIESTDDEDEDADGDGDGDAAAAEEFTGFAEPPPINQEDEYIDEDKYTTVTIESVAISRQGFSRPDDTSGPVPDADLTTEKDDQAKDSADAKHAVKRDANGKRIWTKERPRTEWPKKKKKKFRYESKAERKVARYKEGAKKRRQKEARSKDKD